MIVRQTQFCNGEFRHAEVTMMGPKHAMDICTYRLYLKKRICVPKVIYCKQTAPPI